MAGYEFQRSQISGEKLCGALGAILMIDSVKSIATDPLRKPFIRAGVYGRWFRQSAVKAGVEHGHLENRADTFLDNLDSFQLGAIMQWRKDGHARDGRFHLRCDGGGLLEALTTFHQTVNDYD